MARGDPSARILAIHGRWSGAVFRGRDRRSRKDEKLKGGGSVFQGARILRGVSQVPSIGFHLTSFAASSRLRSVLTPFIPPVRTAPALCLSNQCAISDRSRRLSKTRRAHRVRRQKATNCRINATNRCRGRHLFHSRVVIDAQPSSLMITTSSGSWSPASERRKSKSPVATRDRRRSGDRILPRAKSLAICRRALR